MRNSRLGLFVKCPHPEMVEAIGIAGFDFAILDMEHTPLGPRDLYPLVLAARARGLRLVVRLPANYEMYIKWCLDLGVYSIQIPNVETVDDVKRVAEFVYFSPLGNRGLCRFVRAADFSRQPKDEYLVEANASVKVILQIEGEKAVGNVDKILETITETPMLLNAFSLFIGPYDLSASIGKPGDVWDPEVTGRMLSIIERCKEVGVSVGTFVDSSEGLLFWKKQVDFIAYGSDLNLFLCAADRLIMEMHDEGGRTVSKFVARLNDMGHQTRRHNYSIGDYWNAVDEAADRIEELERELIVQRESLSGKRIQSPER